MGPLSCHTHAARRDTGGAEPWQGTLRRQCVLGACSHGAHLAFAAASVAFFDDPFSADPSDASASPSSSSVAALLRTAFFLPAPSSAFFFLGTASSAASFAFSSSTCGQSALFQNDSTQGGPQTCALHDTHQKWVQS